VSNPKAFKLVVLVLLVAFALGFGSSMRMMKKAAVVGVATVMLGSGAAFAVDIESGSQVFQDNCTACHAGGNNVIQAEKTLRKDTLDQYVASGLNEASIVTQVARTHALTNALARVLCTCCR